MCFYERPSFLKLIAHNVCTQTFVRKFPSQVELVIADDSVDNMKLDIQALKTELKDVLQEEHITYLNLNEKLTIGEKRNLLCRTAKHNVFIFMDDDDYYFPSYIEYSLTELYKRRKALVGSNSMLFCYVDEQFKKLSINCMSSRQIHEATMCMLKSHWEQTGGFAVKGNGEGANLIDGHEQKVNAKLDISKLMVCVCHPKNTCNKRMFLSLGTPADYVFDDSLKQLVYDCIHHPLYEKRVRICFKYATRSRPNQFKTTLDLYMLYLSNKHDYHFVVSMDTDDTTMNNDDIRSYLNTKRKQYQLEYYYGTSKNKIDAINRDMLAPSFDILVLISDDMIPQVQDYDDIIVHEFQETFPTYDGMLNFNDGLRNDWPALCTLTVYGHVYYERFGYIYHPSYESVYCDQEQTLVGTMLKKIKNIDRVIIKHDWTNIVFQDDLRKKTETNEQYARDRAVFEKRKAAHFDLKTLSTDQSDQSLPESKPYVSCCLPPVQAHDTRLTIIAVGDRPCVLNDCLETLNTAFQHNPSILVQGHYSTTDRLLSFSYLHRLTFSVSTPYVTFYFPNESCLPTYSETIVSALNRTPDIDILTFAQTCSLDGGKHSFIVRSNMQYSNDSIPSTGPWKQEYHRNVCNWSIFRTSLWKDVPLNDNDDTLLTDMMTRIKNNVSLDNVIYTYTVQ